MDDEPIQTGDGKEKKTRLFFLPSFSVQIAEEREMISSGRNIAAAVVSSREKGRKKEARRHPPHPQNPFILVAERERKEEREREQHKMATIHLAVSFRKKDFRRFFPRLADDSVTAQSPFDHFTTYPLFFQNHHHHHSDLSTRPTSITFPRWRTCWAS